MAFVYLLRCHDSSLYCGWTTDLDRRLGEHAKGTGARYTRSRLPVALAAAWETEDRARAQPRGAHQAPQPRGQAGPRGRRAAGRRDPRHFLRSSVIARRGHAVRQRRGDRGRRPPALLARQRFQPLA